MKRVLFLLGHLNDLDIEWMINNGSKAELETGDRLIRKGETIENLYIILSRAKTKFGFFVFLTFLFFYLL